MLQFVVVDGQIQQQRLGLILVSTAKAFDFSVVIYSNFNSYYWQKNLGVVVKATYSTNTVTSMGITGAKP
jgi:hypothetical protein